MTSQDKIICIFGGSGFLGRHITQELARAGFRLKIATRIPESAYALKTYGAVGQIVPFQCDYNDEKSIQSAVEGCYGVINLVGILYKKGKSTFERTHVDLAEKIAKASAIGGVQKYIHMSALGVDKGISKYAKSKLKGESVVQKSFPSAVILRPSVVFGAGDNFFNIFAKLAAMLPILPLIGGGQTKFQPVYVDDIAEAVGHIMSKNSDQYDGKVYELGGPEVVTFKEVYERLSFETNRHIKLVSVPFSVAKIQGAILGMAPKPLLTVDQVKSLTTDNVVQQDALTLIELDVEPTAMKTILPKYLCCYRRGGRFADKECA